MKALKTLASAALLVSATASANVHYDAENNAACVTGDKGTLFCTYVDPSRDCKPDHAFVEQTTNYQSVGQTKNIAFKARIDRKSPWSGDLHVIVQQEWTTGLLGNTPGFVTELRRGNTLRINIPQTNGGQFYEAYSLMGYSRAIGQAKAACNPHSDYFNAPASGGNHSEYFL